MSSKISMVKSVVVAVALAAGVSGIAQADDNSMSRWGGDGYAYFHQDAPIVSKAPSTFKQANPHGLSEQQYQALSDESETWQLASPVFDYAPSSWRQSHPHGLTERELQALSNEDPPWQYPVQSETSALASTDNATITTSVANEPFGARLAKFFHVSPGGSAPSAN
jgi:hypothetical protein